MKKLTALDPKKVQDYLLYGIALIFAGIGFHHGAKGFAFIMDTPIIAWFFMLAIVIGMLVMEFRLKAQIENGQPLRILAFTIGIYTVLALVNMLGNFNTFFTKPLKSQLIIDEREAVKKELSLLLAYANDSLEQRILSDKIRSSVENDLKNLKSEITDPNDLGIGQDAEDLLEHIAQTLEVKSITPPTTGRLKSRTQAQALYAELEQDIRSRLDAKIKEIKASSLEQDFDYIKGEGAQVLNEIERASNSSDTKDDEEVLVKAEHLYNKTLGILAAHVKNVDSRFKVFTLQFRNLNNFFFTINRALSGKYTEAAWMALGQAMLIDFIVPIIFIGAVGRKEDETQMVRINRLEKELAKEKETTMRLKQTITSLKKAIADLRNSLTV